MAGDAVRKGLLELFCGKKGLNGNAQPTAKGFNGRAPSPTDIARLDLPGLLLPVNSMAMSIPGQKEEDDPAGLILEISFKSIDERSGIMSR